MASDRFCINESELSIKQAVADELQQALIDLGFTNPSESAIKEHCRIVQIEEDGLDYYWDDILLISTRTCKTASGVRITRYEQRQRA